MSVQGCGQLVHLPVALEAAERPRSGETNRLGPIGITDYIGMRAMATPTPKAR